MPKSLIGPTTRFRRAAPAGPWMLVAGAMAVAAFSAAPSPAQTVGADAAPAAAVPEEVRPPTRGPDGFWRITFGNLAAFDYRAPGSDSLAPSKPVPGRKDGIPGEVQGLDGRKVRIEGYMLPVAMDKSGSVSEFMIMRSVQTCCYGATPEPTEWVVVKVGPKGPKVKPTMDVPLVFFGTLHVGEVYRTGQFAGIYELEFDKLTKP